MINNNTKSLMISFGFINIFNTYNMREVVELGLPNNYKIPKVDGKYIVARYTFEGEKEIKRGNL